MPQKHITRVDILGFEFEMGLFPNVLDEARAKGIDIAPKYIPAEVFDKRAVEKNQVVFHDVAAIEVTPHVKKNSVAVELTDFSVFYSQDSIANAEAELKDKASKIVVEKGQIVKVSKDAKGIVKREVLTKHWTDWIDYWAVDFNFESKREISPGRRTQDRWTPQEVGIRDVWTGDYIFENEWQSFRTKKDRSLELKSVFHECTPGRRKMAVKVVDIFGNDTMTIVEVNVGGRSRSASNRAKSANSGVYEQAGNCARGRSSLSGEARTALKVIFAFRADQAHERCRDGVLVEPGLCRGVGVYARLPSNFEGVVEKAKLACFNSGHRIEDHFVDVTEMVDYRKWCGSDAVKARYVAFALRMLSGSSRTPILRRRSWRKGRPILPSRHAGRNWQMSALRRSGGFFCAKNATAITFNWPTRPKAPASWSQ